MKKGSDEQTEKDLQCQANLCGRENRLNALGCVALFLADGIFSLTNDSKTGNRFGHGGSLAALNRDSALATRKQYTHVAKWYLHSVYSISMTSETNEIASSVAISRHSDRSRRDPDWSQFYGRLCSHKIGWLANGTQLQMRQSPLSLLDKHQRDAKLSRDAVASIGSILGLTADQDGGIVVHAHLDLVQAERFILQVTRLMSRKPLLPGQQEAERPYANKIVRQ